MFMEYRVGADPQESVRVTDAQSGRQCKPENTSVRRGADFASQPSLPEEPPKSWESGKALADSVPGTEYWLP